MELAALVLLDDNPDAVKLVATWPVAGEGVTLKDASDDADEFGIARTALDHWSRVSGVDEDDLTRILPMLVFNQIIGNGGHIDDHAKSYINAKVAAKLPKPKAGS